MHGEAVAKVKALCDKQKKPYPPTLPVRPVLDPWMMVYYRAYCDLSTCRSFSSAGPCSIPWRDTIQWADRYGIDGDELWGVISEADSWYLGHLAEENDKRYKASSQKH